MGCIQCFQNELGRAPTYLTALLDCVAAGDEKMLVAITDTIPASDEIDRCVWDLMCFCALVFEPTRYERLLNILNTALPPSRINTWNISIKLIPDETKDSRKIYFRVLQSHHWENVDREQWVRSFVQDEKTNQFQWLESKKMVPEVQRMNVWTNFSSYDCKTTANHQKISSMFETWKERKLQEWIPVLYLLAKDDANPNILANITTLSRVFKEARNPLNKTETETKKDMSRARVMTTYSPIE